MGDLIKVCYSHILVPVLKKKKTEWQPVLEENDLMCLYLEHTTQIFESFPGHVILSRSSAQGLLI